MRTLACLTLLALAASTLAVEPIASVRLGADRELVLNDKPFLPIMVWLQDPDNLPRAVDIGCNAVAGYWPESGGTKDVVEYMDLVTRAGLYGVMPYHDGLKGNPSLLGYIHDDEPDLTHQESDAEVTPGDMLRVNTSTPLWQLVDGVTHTWSVLDPMEGASFAIALKAPVTVTRLGVWLTISPGLAVARDVAFLGDGKRIAEATLEPTAGRQEVPLDEPATFTQLSVQVRTAHPGEQVWGSISEIEGFDAAGTNLLLAPPRKVARQTPGLTVEHYRCIRQADPSRPVFLTLTAGFMPTSDTWTQEQRKELYPVYVQAADVLGFDIYPLYGWGRADWIRQVAEGQAELRALAPDKAAYQWIETSRGGQWVSEDSPEVKPEHIRAEVWMAICQGATGIGYFTHIWKPAYSQFGVPPANVAALKQLNAQLTRLAPQILAPDSPRKVAMELEGGRLCDSLAKEHEGALYVFAVNSDPGAQAAGATFHLEGLSAGQSIEVVDENRTLKAEAGLWRDAFEPFAVHIYRITKGPDAAVP